jgi:hypothetical protein
VIKQAMPFCGSGLARSQKHSPTGIAIDGLRHPSNPLLEQTARSLCSPWLQMTQLALESI